ncbi:MAG: winged helix-turn-helix domain-containing protein [Propionibacteriaceae bacterium]|nr:winged helix-turn-helix domain-containing protein [Propionibacteriaceae bacterium]
MTRRILAELQLNGRLSVTHLVARVGLTISPTHRRAGDLDAVGVLDGGLEAHSEHFRSARRHPREPVRAALQA